MKQSLTGMPTGSWPDGKIYSLKAHSMLFKLLARIQNGEHSIVRKFLWVNVIFSCFLPRSKK